MTRFVLPYAEKSAPPRRRWTAWRVFFWTLLLSSVVFWSSALITR
jgi:hypothetical protein